jgi:ribokinase
MIRTPSATDVPTVEVEPETHPRASRDDAGDPRPAIVVVGSINMDMVVRTPRMPQPGQTVLGDSFDTNPGGKGANQAVAVARLGGRCRMIGCLGQDAFGTQLLDHLHEEKVDVASVTRLKEVSSGVAIITVDGQGENAITVVSGANGGLTPDHITQFESVIRSAKVLVVQLEIPLETAAAALSLARRHGVKTILDPAPAPSVDLPDALYEVDILSPNQSEAEALVGQSVRDITGAKSAAAELVRRGARQVVMKLGADGAQVVADDGSIEHISGFEVEVVDTTAAGDAFTAAMALAWAEGMALTRAVRFGCAAGALAVTRFGAQQAMPNRAAVDQLVARGV